MRRRRALPAALAVVLLLGGQLVALAHEAEERHVTCDEHGEQVEAATLADPLHACDHDHWIAVEGDGGAHEDCAIARALRQSASPAASPAALASVLALAPISAPHAVSVVITAPRYRIAPKTSPPA